MHFLLLPISPLHLFFDKYKLTQNAVGVREKKYIAGCKYNLAFFVVITVGEKQNKLI